MAFKTRFRRKGAIFRTGRRYGKRFVSKKVRSHRIFKKFIRRTAIRPELKFDDHEIIADMAAQTNVSHRLTADTIGQGVGASGRIGNQIRTIKVDVRMYLRNSSSTTAALAPVQSSFMTRVIIWSPRGDFQTIGQNTMTALTFNQFVDYNAVTVHRDMNFILYPPYMEEGPTDATPAGNGKDKTFKRFSIKFPRKVYFPIGSNLIDEEKYGIYVTLIAQGATAYIFNTRMFYFDA